MSCTSTPSERRWIPGLAELRRERRLASIGCRQPVIAMCSRAASCLQRPRPWYNLADRYTPQPCWRAAGGGQRRVGSIRHSDHGPMGRASRRSACLPVVGRTKSRRRWEGRARQSKEPAEAGHLTAGGLLCRRCCVLECARVVEQRLSPWDWSQALRTLSIRICG